MLNEKGLKLVINYLKEKNEIKVEKEEFDENQFALQFDSKERVSENDFIEIEKELEKENIYLNCVRISGVYEDGDANKKMIQELVGVCFE